MPRMLTVDAVIFENKKIVLVKRKCSPYRGFFALPGGYVEGRESAEKAVVREVKEETGLTVKPVRMTGVYDDPGRDSRGNVTIAFLCRIVKGKIKSGSDSDEAAFFDLEKLPENMAFDHKKIISDAKKITGVGKVLAGGVFNIIHPGHIHFLREAKELGDELVVVVANDRTVVRSNKRLLFPAKVRAQTAKSIAYVDRVVVGDEKNQMKIVKKERPDIIAIGYDQDYNAIKLELASAGIRCRIKRISKLKNYSTKKIMEMIE